MQSNGIHMDHRSYKLAEMTNKSLILIYNITGKNELYRMSGWRSQSSLVVRLSMDQRTGGIKSFFSCQQLKMSVRVVEKKLPAAQKDSQKKSFCINQFGLAPPTYGTLAGTESSISVSGKVSLSSHLHVAGRTTHPQRDLSPFLPCVLYLSLAYL